MSHDFIDDLIKAVNRVMAPDAADLRDVLIVSGMPEKTENLRYLAYNRHVEADKGRTLEFSAVAVLNNRRIPRWRLAGPWKRISQAVFSTRWTRNPLDLFLNGLRVHPEVTDLLAALPADYTLLGILTLEEVKGRGLIRRIARQVRPVVAAPGLEAAGLKRVEAFETANTIHQTRMIGYPLERLSVRPHSGR
jgi:hypothetical protein